MISPEESRFILSGFGIIGGFILFCYLISLLWDKLNSKFPRIADILVSIFFISSIGTCILGVILLILRALDLV